MPIRTLSIFIILLATTTICVEAQDFSALKPQKPVTLHGSLGAGLSFYSSNQPYKTQDPFAWNIYGSLAPSIYGIALPFSFVITQYSKSYTSPFTQFGVSPSYKWIRLHLGYRNISFSPFTFDGQSFLGAGIELTPGKFYLGAFFGRLNKAINEDTTFSRNIQPQYGRKGYGLKIGYGNSNENISFQFFHAKDDTASITRYHDSLTTILPMENTVLGSSWHFMFFKRLTLTGDLAISLLNRDMYYQRIDSIGYVKIPSLVQSINPINYSSTVSYSGQAQLALVLNSFNASAGYRRIAPDFLSLGVPYMLNDVEMISGSAAASLLKGRLSLNIAANSQHNNLGHMLSTALQTRTGNFGLNAFLSQHVNLNFNLTGVTVVQKDGLLHLSDSVKMDQIMWNATLSPVFTFSNSQHQHTISISVNYTDLDDRNPATTAQASTQSFSSSASYALFFSQAYWGINGSLLYTQYKQQNNLYRSTGLNAGLSVQLLSEHNLMTQVSAGYFVNSSANGQAANNTTFSFNSSYSRQRNSFGFYLSYILTPPVNLNPLAIVNHIPIAVNSKNLSGGLTYACRF